MENLEKLIEAAEWCCKCEKSLSRLDFCQRCKFADECDDIWEPSKEELVLAVRSNYKSLLASERSKVIAEVREIIKDNTIEVIDAGHFTRSVVEADELLDVLDSMAVWVREEANNA